jgi:Rieske Fe-S protein
MSDTPRSDSMPRRSFLDLLLGLGALGTAGAALFPVFKYLEPLPMESGGGPVRLSDAQRSKLEHDSYVIVSAGTTRIIVFEDPSKKVHALSAKCTHEGCTVQYSLGENVIWCACHNGHFDLDGRVISGPPPKPLTQYAVETDKDGSLIVDTETA